jgi:hypothetical protein
MPKHRSKYGDLLSKDCRISAELEVDSWILQMIDTFDCLLFRIIDKFQLSGIPIDKIELNKVVNVLSAESQKVELANELDNSLHASLLLPDASLDVIPYFEQTLVQLKEFMKNINMKEPAENINMIARVYPQNNKKREEESMRYLCIYEGWRQDQRH